MKMKALTAAEAGVLQLLTMMNESSWLLGNFCLLRWVPKILMFIAGSPGLRSTHSTQKAFTPSMVEK
jgi:hypothetical protein